MGALTLRASAVAPISLALDPPRGPRARGALFHVGLAAAAHLAVLGLSLHAAMASVPEDDELAQTTAARELLISAEQSDRAHDQPIVNANSPRAATCGEQTWAPRRAPVASGSTASARAEAGAARGSGSGRLALSATWAALPGRAPAAMDPA